MYRKSPATLFEATADQTQSASVANAKKGSRDDFKSSVKLQLAQRVGYLCSHPNCQRPTIGPKMGARGAVNVGIAAHIKAASPGGARYDESQTPEERSGFDNGIWLCANHAHIIDHDEKEFTVDVLRDWKHYAEERAFQQLSTARGPAAVYPAADELVDELRELKAQLALPHEADLDSVRAKVSAGSTVQIEAFEATPRWPRHLVKLELAVEGEEHAGPLDLLRFPNVLRSVQKVVILSAPGTGKTTTLLQIARALVRAGPVPLFVPLGEWAESGTDLLGWVLGREGYTGLSANHLKFLAHHGELALLLDGWNEVPAATRRRLIKGLDGLQRDFPLLNIVMSSRRQALDVPLAGRRLSVLPLSEEQQIEIARAIGGSNSESILDAAWRTAGLRDLVSIPLYLRSLLETSTTGTLPDTKGELLRRMIESHESNLANAELFHRELMGLQQRYLTALAVRGQELGGTVLPQDVARAAVGTVNRALLDEALATTPLNAQSVLDTLVASHSVVQNSGQTYTFQHPQIQEWYASLYVEAAFRAEAGKLTLSHPLVTQRLNDPTWTETILFSCERMSRSDTQGVRMVADVIELLLQIDPLFAATVISRSTPPVWKLVGDHVVSFVQAWHQPSRPDRAVGFMIASRRPEFADIVWPLVSSNDSQIQMKTMRLVDRFNPVVLGEHLARDYASLPERSRETLAGELAFQGDRAGIDAALALALKEPSTGIRYRVFEGLSFRAATRQLEHLLKSSGDELAETVAQRGYLDGIRDKALLDDLERRERALVAADPSPANRLARVLSSCLDAELPDLIKFALRDPAFSFRDRGEQVVAEAAARFPDAVAEALQWRVENCLELPFRPFDYLDMILPTDAGPIVSMVLKEDVTKKGARYAAYLVGTDTVRELVRRFLAARHKCRADGLTTSAAYAASEALAGVLENTRASVFIDVLQGYAEGAHPQEIHDLCDLISRHSQAHDQDELVLSKAQHATAVALLNGWGRQLLDQSASRDDMAKLTWAMRRMPDPSQVSVLADMLAADLAGKRAARAAYAADRSNHLALNDMRISHAFAYRFILCAVGAPEAEAVLLNHLSDPDFGTEAAIGLQVIWQDRNEPHPAGLYQKWPDFGRAAANRARDRNVSTDTADAIFSAAEAAKAEGTPQGLRRALTLAGCAVLLPHGEKSRELAVMLSGDIEARPKLALMQRMIVGGDIVSHTLIKSSLQQLIAEYSDQNSLSQDQMAEIVHFVELLPFSDNPASMLAAIDLVASKFEFGVWHLRNVMGAVRHLPEPERIDLLRGLVQRFPQLVEEPNLYLAMPKPGGSTLDFLSDIAAGRYGERSMKRGTRHDYPQQIYQELPQRERDGLLNRFARAQGDGEKAFLASVLLASADHEIFLMLAADPIGRDVISQHRWATQKSLLYIHEPISQSTSYYELIPRDIQRLREGLFDLTQSGDAKISAFAADYLNRIDATRDQEGGFDSGPRHPNIASGRPWPDVPVPREPARI